MFFYLSLISIPLIFYTIYKKTNKANNLTLGSFFILKNYKSYTFNVRSLKIIELIIIRLLIALLLILLIHSPSTYDLDERIVIDNSYSKSTNRTSSNKIEFLKKNIVLDQYNEDLFFINSFVNNYTSSMSNVKLIFSPLPDLEFKTNNYTYIIFPSIDQNLEFYSRFSKYFYLTNLETEKLSINKVSINNYFPAFISNAKCIATLNNGNCLALTFEEDNNKFLIFTSSLGTFWGELGVSAYFIDIIDSYLNEINYSKNQNLNIKTKPSELVSSLPDINFLNILLILLIIESAIFIFRRKFLYIILVLFSTNISASGFKFIVLDYDNTNYLNFASKSKEYIESRTSIKFDENFFQSLSINKLDKSFLPDVPFIWVFGCNQAPKINNENTKFFKNFINKGGIIFSDSCGVGKDFTYNYAIEQIVYLTMNAKSLNFIDYEKAILKSFFILDKIYLKGIPVSYSTNRIPLYISRNNLVSRVLRGDDQAYKIMLNIVMYMLSGNYKSDQVHTRHILERIKNKELSR